MRPGIRKVVAISISLLFFMRVCEAVVYRVGPAEKHTTVSEVAPDLKPGDVVEVTGDIADSFTLTAHGVPGVPIVVRGVTTVVNGSIVRPRITPPSLPSANIITCKGDWTVIEGLDISGQTEGAFGNAALIQACSYLTIRNCRFHHNYRAIHSIEEATGDTLVEYTEFDANGYAERPPVAFYSIRPEAKVFVQHCYFHDGTGGNFLRLCVPRSVVQYCWFENPYEHAVQVSTPAFFGEPERPELAAAILPFHSSIIGNVVVFGWGPGSAYCAFSLGGDSLEAPGTEGEFTVAHNLVLTRRGGATPQVAVLVHGNVDRVALYNNVFLGYGVRGSKVYERGEKWPAPRTALFAKARGTTEPVIQGSNNWVYQDAGGVPVELNRTARAANPGFLDLVDGDFQPVPQSPLTAAGLAQIPAGSYGPMAAAYEPRRGIPADLKPKARRHADVPSIGPFESSEVAPPFEDDSADLVLSVRDSGGRFAWPLGFAQMRRRSLECLHAGKSAEAVRCAKMEYLLCPMDEPTLEKVIAHVQGILLAADGNDVRAKAFERFVRVGRAGVDGKLGTADDLPDPIPSAAGESKEEREAFYKPLDAGVDLCATVGAAKPWPMTDPEQSWYQTEKVFVRLDAADFDGAWEVLVPILAEAVRRPAGDVDGQKVMQRNQGVVDRLAAALSVIARARGASIAGAREFVTNCLDYAKHNPGPDGVLGTQDDLELAGIERFLP